MKSYMLKKGEIRKLGDKTEQHYMMEYSEIETNSLYTEIHAFVKSQEEKGGDFEASSDPSPPGGIRTAAVRKNLNIVAAEDIRDLTGIVQSIVQAPIP